jgi:hypothetical protein
MNESETRNLSVVGHELPYSNGSAIHSLRPSHIRLLPNTSVQASKLRTHYVLPFFDVATNLPDGMFPHLDVSAASFVRNGSCPGTVSCSFRIWKVRRLRRAKDRWSICRLHRAKDKLVEKLGVEPRTFSTQRVHCCTMLRRCHTARPYPRLQLL